jgi:hypothetical protein
MADPSATSNAPSIGDDRRNLLKLARARKALQERQNLEHCKDDPYYWVTHHTRSRDDQWAAKGTPPSSGHSTS